MKSTSSTACHSILLLSILISISLVESRFLDVSNVAPSVNVTYSSSLACAQCIYGGYTYCVRAAEGLAASSEPTQ